MSKIVYSHSNVLKLEQKILKLEKKVAIQSCSLRYYKRRFSEQSTSKNLWKKKCKAVRLELKRLKQSNMRLRKRLDKSFSMDSISSYGVERSFYPFTLIHLCVLLRVYVMLDYRCISRLIGFLNLHFSLGFSRTPCANTIHHWVDKLGLFLLEKTDTNLSSKPICLIADESINIGQEKLLLLLAAPCEVCDEGILTQTQVEVVGLHANTSMKADTVTEYIQESQATKGLKIAYMLSDQDAKLLKASKTLSLMHIADISHLLANCLKKTLSKQESYQKFIEQISNYKKYGNNTNKAYLLPPKLRQKARFMNQDSLVQWAKAMLLNYAKLKQEEQDFFQSIKEHQPIIEALDKTMQIHNQVAQILKPEALSAKSLEEVEQILEKAQGKFPKVFAKHLKEAIKIYYEPHIQNNTKYYCCSDIIESIFGRYKNKLATNPQIGIASQCLEIPLYTQTLAQIKQEITDAINQISLTNIAQWKQDKLTENQQVTKRNIFQNEKNFSP